MLKLAFHIRRDGKIFRGIVDAVFAKNILEGNFPDDLMQSFFKRAQAVQKISPFMSGVIMVDEQTKKVISDQTAFRLESLEHIYEPWEYVELGLFEKIEDMQ